MPRAAAPFLSPAVAQGARQGWPGVRGKGEEQKVVDERQGRVEPSTRTVGRPHGTWIERYRRRGGPTSEKALDSAGAP